MITQLFPVFERPKADLSAWLDGLYAYPDQPWFRLNLVSSLNGELTGPDGVSDSLSSPWDRHILHALRRQSQALIIGARSVCVESFPVPGNLTLIIPTNTGNLEGSRLRLSPEVQPIFLGPKSAQARLADTFAPLHEFVEVKTNLVSDLTGLLGDLGLGRVVCEGGGGLAGKLLRAGVIDELCLSVSASLSREPKSIRLDLDMKFWQKLRLNRLLLDDESFLYGQWRLAARQKN